MDNWVIVIPHWVRVSEMGVLDRHKVHGRKGFPLSSLVVHGSSLQQGRPRVVAHSTHYDSPVHPGSCEC